MEVYKGENPFQAHLVVDDVNANCKIDGLKPKNRVIAHFIFFFDRLFLQGKLKENAGEFYVLQPAEFEHLQSLYFSHHAEKSYLIGYKGNYFTSDIYLKSYPFIDFKQLFILTN